MSPDNPAKVTCNGIKQIAIVVENLELVAENYWNILGIGPWSIYRWEAPSVFDRRYHGRPAWAREKIALAEVGDVELELVQPVDGDSIYRDWLDEHGEGLHHLKFLVDDVDETAGILAKEGFPSIQSGRFGQKGHEGAYNYIDIKPLRTIWEPVNRGGGLGMEPTILPDTLHDSPARVKCTNINQVAVVVEDLESVAESYQSILNIGPWTILDWEAPRVYDRTYHGKPAWAREKIAITLVGDVQLELVQPVDGDSIYRDWLDEHGEGLHHINFLVDDVDEVAETLAGEGFPSIQSGRFGPEERGGAYNYIDIKPLRTIWEPVHPVG
jgi:catechol 2,3-dioxygenase-like lactoylglutathione lyase family enzyme